MTTINGSDPPPASLEQEHRVRIADLSPRDVELTTTYVEARIALVWPYSSSTRQYAFLLSETDIRPLKNGRQLKVTLHNGVARTVQAAKVGIGDTVKLSLNGCQWTEAQDETATPGKRNHWDISFRSTIALEVRHGGVDPPQLIQYTASEEILANGDNHTNGVATQVLPPPGEDQSISVPAISPAARKSSGSAALLYRAVHDPFLDEIEQESGRSRKRTKFARKSDAWTLVDDDAEVDMPASSPTKATDVQGLGEGDIEAQRRTMDESGDVNARKVDTTEEAAPSQHLSTTLDAWPAEPARDPPQTSAIPAQTHEEVIELLSSPELSQADTEARQEEAHELHGRSNDRQASPVVQEQGGGHEASQSSTQEDREHRRLSSPVEISTSPLHSITSKQAETGHTSSLLESEGSSGNQNGLPVYSEDFPSPSRMTRAEPDLGHSSPIQSMVAPDSASPFLQQVESTNTAQALTFDSAKTKVLPTEADPVEDIAEEPMDHYEASAKDVPPSPAELPSESEVTTVMGPPKTPHAGKRAPRPQLNMPGLDSPAEGQAITPRLMPIASPGLPLVSPLVKQRGVETGYFPTSSEELVTSHREVAALDADDSFHSENDHSPAPTRTYDSQPQSENIEHHTPFEATEVSSASHSSEPIPDNGNVAMERTVIEITSDAETESEPTAGIHPQEETIQEKSRDALSFLEDFLKMSPVFEKGASEHNPFALEAAAQQSITRDPRTRAAGHERTEVVSEDIDINAELSMHAAGDFAHEGLRVGDQNDTLDRPSALDGTADHRLDYDETNNASSETAQTQQDKQKLRDDIVPAAREQLPTPEATQQMPEEDHESTEPQIALQPVIPPTPEPTQASKPATDEAPFASNPPPATPYRDQPAEARPPPSTIRRTSQRLVRKSDVAIKIDSPFFSSTGRKIEAQEMKPEAQSMSQIPRQQEVKITQAGREGTPEERRGLQTDFGYYVSLLALSQYYGQEVDVIAVATQDSSKAVQAKAGPRDWHTTLKLMDQRSSNDEFLTTAQVFRPYKSALPRISKGDVVMLRRFKVQTVKHSWMLLSTDESAWAVSKASNDGDFSIEMTGPHLEYGNKEVDFMKELGQWWQSSQSQFNDVDNATEEISAQQDQSALGDKATTTQSAIIPSIEAAGPSSPRRSRRRHAGPTSEDAPDQSVKSPTPDPNAVTLKPSTRQQPSRRARTKTPQQGSTQAMPTPLIEIGRSSVAASSPPTSPTHTRRRTRSTMSPNPSIASNAVSFTSSVDMPATSPTLQAPPNEQVKTRAIKGKARAAAAAQSSAASTQEDLDNNATTATDLSSTAAAPSTTATAGPSSPVKRHRTRSHRHTISPPLVHELRDGMRYVDGGSAEETVEEAKKKGVVTAERVRKGLRSQDVHELRDGVRWVDQ